MALNEDAALRQHLLKLLKGEGAHLSVEEAFQDWPAKLRGAKPAGSPHTPWQLVEHLRIAQWDILEFSRNPKHVSPEFPHGYWPKTASPPDEGAWDASVASFLAELKAMQDLVADSRNVLFARVRHPDAEAHHTLLREALILVDHNSYHIGQLILLRRMLAA
jgi:hypothetical protein